MCKLSTLSLANSMDAVICMGNIFGYFTPTEDFHVLKGVSEVLREKGIFVLHLPDYEYIESNLRRKDWFETPNFYVLSENRWKKYVDRITIFTTYTLIRKSNGKVSKKFQRINLYKTSTLKTVGRHYNLRLYERYQERRNTFLIFRKLTK